MTVHKRFAAVLAINGYSLTQPQRKLSPNGSSCSSTLSHCRQRLIEIGDDVFDVLNSDRDADHAVG